jgi:hypothetical protein
LIVLAPEFISYTQADSKRRMGKQSANHPLLSLTNRRWVTLR